METDDDYYVIKCRGCGAMIFDEDYDTVITLWNRRVNSEEQMVMQPYVNIPMITDDDYSNYCKTDIEGVWKR